jgi:hypothetical protein
MCDFFFYLFPLSDSVWFVGAVQVRWASSVRSMWTTVWLEHVTTTGRAWTVWGGSSAAVHQVLWAHVVRETSTNVFQTPVRHMARRIVFSL